MELVFVINSLWFVLYIFSSDSLLL